MNKFKLTKEMISLTLLLVIFLTFVGYAFTSYEYYRDYSLRIQPFVYGGKEFAINITSTTTGSRDIPNAFSFRTYDYPLAVSISLENVTRLRELFSLLDITLTVIYPEREIDVFLDLDSPINDIYLKDLDTSYPVNVRINFVTKDVVEEEFTLRLKMTATETGGI